MDTRHQAVPIAAGEDESGAVLEHLPHRPPFRFLSSVRHLVVGKEGTGVWSITGEEWFFAGHFPEAPVVPGVLLIEALAQLSGLVGLHVAPPAAPARRAGRLVQTEIRFDAGVSPPADIELHSRLARSMQALRQFDVSAAARGVTLARGSLVLAEVGGP